MLIYDGDCGFCTQCARWLRTRLPERYAVEPWQSLDLATWGLTEHDVSTAAYWVDATGTHRGATGIARCLIAMGTPWSIAGQGLSVPPLSWLARGAYRLIANNRYRLPGATDACRLDNH